MSESESQIPQSELGVNAPLIQIITSRVVAVANEQALSPLGEEKRLRREEKGQTLDAPFFYDYHVTIPYSKDYSNPTTEQQISIKQGSYKEYGSYRGKRDVEWLTIEKHDSEVYLRYILYDPRTTMNTANLELKLDYGGNVQGGHLSIDPLGLDTERPVRQDTSGGVKILVPTDQLDAHKQVWDYMMRKVDRLTQQLL